MKPRLPAKSERAPVDTVDNYDDDGSVDDGVGVDGGGSSGSNITGLRLSADSDISDSSSGVSPSLPLSVLSDPTYLPPPPTVAGGKGPITTGSEVRANVAWAVLPRST